MNDQQMLRLRFEAVLDSGKDLRQARLVLQRLDQRADRAHSQTALSFVFTGDQVHGNVAAVDIVLQSRQYGPTVHVGQVDIERNGAGLAFLHSRQRIGATRLNHSFETLLVRRLQEDRAEARVIFHNQHHPVFRLDLVAVVVES